jgi:hypothetical protein
MVAWYAIEDPDPEQERWRTQEPSGGRHAGDDIHISAINSVRGRAAEAVRDLIFHDGSRLGHFLPTLDRMVEDPSIAVRSCVASTLRAVLRHDRDLVVLGRNNPSLYTVKGRPLYVHLNGLAIVLLK